MRVITGSAKGRRLRVGRGQAIRPTASKVRGAVFNILASRFDLDGANLLDLFAGAGGLGIEALSRGARHVTFIESAARAADILSANLDLCGLTARARVVRAVLPAALRRLAPDARFDGVFLDPPYGRGLAVSTLDALGNGDLVAAAGWVVVEHAAEEDVGEGHGRLRLTDARRYGKTALAIFVADGEDHSP